jgi:hypothetical protein
MSNVTDNRNVLIAVTAKNCGACESFKNSGAYEKLLKEVRNSGVVRIVEIVKDKMSDTIEPPFPTQLNILVGWYPTFILANGKAWNEKFSQHKNSDLPVEILNGTFKDGAVKMSDTRITFDKCLSWVTEHIDSNPKFGISTNTLPQIINKLSNLSMSDLEEMKISKDAKKIYIPTCGQFMKYKRSSRR